MPNFLRVFSILLMVSAMLIAQDLNTSGPGNSGILYGDALLYDQTGNPGTNGSPSQYFPDFLGAGESADDFTVPAGEVWTVDTVYVVGTFSSTGGYVSVDVNIYLDDGPGGMPGTLFYNENVLAAVAGTGPIFTVPLATPMVLPEGHHWFNFMVNMPFIPEGQFFWSNSNVPQIDSFRVFRDSTNLFGTGSFGTWATCEGSTIGGGVEPDLQFAFYGTTGSGPTGGVLLISENSTGADSVEAWLNALGETYTRMTNTVALGMPTSDWLMYDCAFYIGTASSGSQIDSCTAYMNGGGNLLVWDNDQGYFYGTTPFLLDYLMAAYQTDGGSSGIISGLDMMAGITLDISADPYPDDFLPSTGTFGTGVPVFLAPTTTTYAGMRGDGGSFRSELLAWDPQNGGAYATNVEVLRRSILWLADGIIPVELTSFGASVNNGTVELNWATATELNNRGFDVERNSGTGFEKVGYVPGFGTTTEPRSYSFKDEGLSSGTYEYRLKQIDFDGTFAYSQVIETEVVLPKVYAMDQNYPNPFNPSTKINFSLAVDSKVSLKIFDVLGQEVTTLVNEELSAGTYNYDFNATNINSGVYFYRIEAVGVNGAKFVDIKKMMLLK